MRCFINIQAFGRVSTSEAEKPELTHGIALVLGTLGTPYIVRHENWRELKRVSIVFLDSEVLFTYC